MEPKASWSGFVALEVAQIAGVSPTGSRRRISASDHRKNRDGRTDANAERQHGHNSRKCRLRRSQSAQAVTNILPIGAALCSREGLGGGVEDSASTECGSEESVILQAGREYPSMTVSEADAFAV